MAIQRLEDSLDGMEHGSEEHINTMHQIAALSYNFDTLKARSYYELILYQNPNDRSALFWLVRTYILLVDPESAIRTIEGIVENQDLTEKEKARLQMDMGFNLMIKGDFKTAADLLETLEPEIIRLDNDDLTLKWMVDLAIAYERLDQVDESERLLFEAIEKIEQTGINAHLPRAYNVMGLIWEKRASSYPSYSVDYLRRALDFYEKQFSAGQTLNKLREQSEALHFQGRVRLELADIDRANENFSKSFQLSREHGHVGSEFKARLGLAQIEYARGNTEAACRHVTGAERHFEKNMGPNLGPTSRKILKELGCGFKPVPDL